MTEEKMREALEEIAEHIKNPGRYNSVIDLICSAALSTKQEAGEVSRSQTAQAREEAARIAEGRFYLSDGFEQWKAGELIAKAIRALNPDAVWRDRQVLEEAASELWRLSLEYEAQKGRKWKIKAQHFRFAATHVRSLKPLPAPPEGDQK